MPGTNCAVACQSPILTPREYAIVDYLATVSNLIGIPMLLLLLATWCFDRQRRKQHLVIWTALGCLVASLSFTPLLSVWGWSWERRFCHDNAVAIAAEDGATACNANAFLNSGGIVFSWGCWLLSAVELYWLICRPRRTQGLGWLGRWRVQLCLVLLAPLLVMLTAAGTSRYGYYPGQFHACFLSMENVGGRGRIDWIWWSFCFTYAGAGCILAMRATYVTVMRVRQVIAVRNVAKFRIIVRRLNALRAPILFVFMAFIWIIIIGIHRLTIDAHPEYLYPDEDWTSCIFEHYDGVSDGSWEGPCGESAHRRISFGIVFLTVLCEYGNGIFLSSIYLFGTPKLGKKLSKSLRGLLAKKTDSNNDMPSVDSDEPDDEDKDGSTSDTFSYIPGWRFLSRLFRKSKQSSASSQKGRSGGAARTGGGSKARGSKSGSVRELRVSSTGFMKMEIRNEFNVKYVYTPT